MKVGVVGLGPIGVEVMKAILGDTRFELVGAVDVAPALAGRPLAEVVAGAPVGLSIDGTAAALIARAPDAVALCTRSTVEGVADDLRAFAAAGVSVVTTCEELASPPDTALVRTLSDAALRGQAALLATGVNPGFVMDRFVIQLAGLCVKVRGVAVERVVDAGLRREPLQKKVGHGLTVEQFRAGVAEGRLGHVGLLASATLLARGLHTELARVEQSIDPVVGEGGRVLGVRQRLVASTSDGRPIELRLQMSVGAPDPHDRVQLDADPPVDVRIAGGLHGDRATVAAVIDGLWRLGRTRRAGLLTVIDVY